MGSSDSLDLHGFRGEDVESAVDKFIIHINNSHLKRARIVTGKGTGTVQKIVINYLKIAGFQWKYEKLSNGKENQGVLVLFLD
jgi:dsDNA-specific endonuclease/ATPase MutS2